MAYCKNCGAQIDDKAAVCVHCGVAVNNSGVQEADNGVFGWGLLGFCIPIVGLILFLVWKDTKPRTAKAAGKGALISVIVWIVMYVLLFALGLGAAISVGTYSY